MSQRKNKPFYLFRSISGRNLLMDIFTAHSDTMNSIKNNNINDLMISPNNKCLFVTFFYVYALAILWTPVSAHITRWTRLIEFNLISRYFMPVQLETLHFWPYQKRKPFHLITFVKSLLTLNGFQPLQLYRMKTLKRRIKM